MEQDTQLLIRVPKDLKGSFEGLCKSRGVKVSEALRAFMASEVLQSATGIKTGEGKPPQKRTTAKPSHPKGAPQAPEPRSPGVKCPDTMDLFDSPKNAQKRTETQVNPLEVGRYCNGVQNPDTGKIEVNRLLTGVLLGSTKRKKKK